MYDNEAWSLTPSTEQKNPAHYEQVFAQLAHAHGYMMMSAPAMNLVTLQPGYIASNGQWEQYVSFGFPAFSARYADAYVVQSQGLETNLNSFTPMVTQAASQARNANPAVFVLAGLSTGPQGHNVTGEQLADAGGSTGGSVDGYWLNIPQQSAFCPECTPQPNTPAAVDYLHTIYG